MKKFNMMKEAQMSKANGGAPSLGTAITVFCTFAAGASVALKAVDAAASPKQ